MKPRIFVFAILAVFLASNASASILSASSQAAGEPSKQDAGHWNAKNVQQDLNVSLGDASNATVYPGPLALSAPVERGGLVVGGTSGVTYMPFSESPALEGLFQMKNEGANVRTAGSWNPGGSVIASGKRGGGRGRHDHDRDTDLGRGRWRDRDRDRKNPYATPEPSTWMLIGSGLLLIGAYAGLRRRHAINF